MQKTLQKARTRDLRLWILLTSALMGITAFLYFSYVILAAARGETEAMVLLDGKALQFFAAHRSPHLTHVMMDLTSLGSVSVVLVLAAIVSALLFSVGDRLGLAHLWIVLVGCAAWPTVFKLFFHRPRPSLVEHLVDASGYSFPSGHSFGSASLYLTFAFFAARYRRSLGYEFFFLGLFGAVIALIALSRMYLGVHYPSDVAAGLCVGSAWSLGVAALFHPLYRKLELEARRPHTAR